MKPRQDSGLAVLYERFRDYEMSSRIEDRLIAGVSAWPLIRFSVFSDNLLPHLMGIGTAHPDLNVRQSSRRFSRGIIGRIRSLKDRILYGPSFAFRPRDILFALTPRQMRLSDGREVAQMLDFFMPGLGCSFAVLESRKPGDDYPSRPNWQRVYHLDGYAGRFKAFVRARRDIAVAARSFVAEMSAELKGVFGVGLDEEKMSRSITRAVCLQLFYGPLFRTWLRRLKVKCVVTVVQYSKINQVLCSAAHEERIPVVELQHGMVYPAHPAYNLAKINERYSPDYLFSWGWHWSEQTRNYALKRTVCMGYPALEYLLTNCPPKVRQGPRKVLFISQGTIGEELSRRAVKLRELLPTVSYEIVYKLHPNETKTWRELYPWLANSKVKIVSNSEMSVYELFRDAASVVGVYSTAVMESLMWQVKGYVFRDLHGGEMMASFFRRGILEGVSSVQELAHCLEADAVESKRQIDGSCFWFPNAAENVVAALRRIVEKGEI